MAVPYKFSNQPAGTILPLGWLDADFAYVEKQLIELVAGTNSQIQFNNNGTFGANPNFVFDNTNVRLGLGVAAPTSTLHVANATGLGNPQVVLSAPDFCNLSFNKGPDLPSDQIARIVTVNDPAISGGLQLTLVTNVAAPILLSPNGIPALIAQSSGDVSVPSGTLFVGQASARTGNISLYNLANTNTVSLTSGSNTSSWTMTLPTGPGAAGQYLQTDGAGRTSWAGGGGGGSAAAPVNSVQFNKAGSFGGSANFVFDETNTWLALGTSSPRANLHISAPANLSAGHIAICSPEYGGITFNSGNNLPADQIARIVTVNDPALPEGAQLSLITDNDHPIILSPNDSPMVKVTSTGVGIGNVQSPVAALQIDKPNVGGVGQVAVCSPDYSVITMNSGNNLPADQVARIVSVNNASFGGGKQLTFITNGAYPILLSPNNLPALYANPNGNISIGGPSSSGASVYIQNSTGLNNPQVDLRAPDYCYLSFSKGASFPADQIARIVTANDSSLPGGLQLSLITSVSAPILLSPNGIPALQAQPSGDVLVPSGTLFVGQSAARTGNISLYNVTNANTVSITSGINASNWTLKLPTGPGTNGFYLQTDGAGNTTWAAGGGGGGGSPAGSDTQVQFNNAGSFGANPNFVFDTTNTRLGIGLSTPTSTLHVANATGLSNPQVNLNAPDYGYLSFGKGPNLAADEIARIVTANTPALPGGLQLAIITRVAAPILLSPNGIPALQAQPSGDVLVPSGTLFVGQSAARTGNISLYNVTNANTVSITSGVNTASWTMKLPTSAGTNGFYLQTDGLGNTTWAAGGGGGGGSPAGSDTQVQFNSSGSFGANSNFVFNTTNTRLGIGLTNPSSTLHVANASGLSPQIVMSAPNFCNLSFNKGPNLPSDQIARIVTVNDPAISGGLQLSLITSVSAPILLSPNGTPALQAQPSGDVLVPSGTLFVGQASARTGNITLYSGSNTNTVSLTSAANASSWTMTLPSNPGTAGQVLSTNGAGVTSWVSGGGGGGSPAGSNTQIQFNNAGSFGANSNFVFNTASTRMGIGITTPTAPLTIQGTLPSTFVGQLDVLNTGTFQQITLRDPSNPNADKRNISLVGYYDGAGPHGNIVCAGDFYLNVNGASATPAFFVNTSAEAHFPLGKINVGAASTTSGTIKLYNSTNANSVTVASGANASNWTMTLPTGPGTAGQVLSTNGAGVTSWVAAGGGGSTSPAGSNTQIQFNNSGTFGANTNFVFNSANTRMGIGTSSPGAPIHISSPNIPNVGQIAISSPDFSAITFGANAATPSNHIGRIVTSNVSTNPGGQSLNLITNGAYPIVLIANNSSLTIQPNGEFQLTSSGSSGTLYIQAGALWFRGGSGTVTKIANA